jgi:hypothetical protein
MSTLVAAQREYVNGLRSLARFVNGHRNILESYEAAEGQTFNLYPGTAEKMAEWTRVLLDGAPLGAVRKEVDDHGMTITRRFGPHQLSLFVARDRVCKKIEVGTRVVTKPDPEALAAVPSVEVSETVFEWECAPVLATVFEVRCRKCQTVIGHWLWKRSGPATGRLEYNANAADDRTCKKCAKAVQP